MSLNAELDLSRSYVRDEQRDYVSLLEKFPWRPTIYLGLGGTGSQAVAKVKTLFLNLIAPQARENQDGTVPNIDPLYFFLALDTDQNACPPGLAPGHEWHHLSVGNLADFSKGLGTTPFFRDWVTKHFPSGAITAGASGFRNLGRLAFMANLSTVDGALRAAREQVGKSSPKVVNPRPAVFLFGSLSGGTGSGTLLDTAFILRHVIPNAEIYGIVGVFDGLPTISQHKRPQMLVNTYCGLKELNVFMTRSVDNLPWDGTIEYPFDVNGKLVEPFDECHLITRKRHDGLDSLITQGHAASFMARLAFMMSAFSFKAGQTPDYSGVMNNHRDALATSHLGTRLCYVVPGLAQVHFPISATANLFALDAARRYLRHQCGGMARPGDEEAAAFVTARGLDYRTLREATARDESGQAPAVGALSYDETIAALMEPDKRYDNREEVLARGSGTPHTRMQAVMSRLTPNVDRVFGDLWPRIEDAVAERLVGPRSLAVGAIDFVEDLRGLLELQRNALDAESQTVAYDGLERQWQQIEGVVKDVVTDDGVFDRTMDWFRLSQARDLLTTFLNEADVTIVDKARNDVTRAVLTRLVDGLSHLVSRLRDVFAAKGLIEEAITAIDRRFTQVATDLAIQAEGREAGVENILSFNVMTQEWRRAYFGGAKHLGPEAVLRSLLGRGWHPRQLLDVAAGAGAATAGMRLAQQVVDQVEALTDTERNWTPLDVLSQTPEYRGISPEEMIAKLYLGHLQPQMQLSAMNDVLGRAYDRLSFCGGVAPELQQRFKATDALKGVELNVSDNMERNRINFFSIALPVSLAGANLVRDLLESEYNRWLNTVSKMPAKDRESAIRWYHCFPGSEAWPRPTAYMREVEEERKLFGRALAISEMLDVTPDDMKKMSSVSKNPKEPLYALFQVGRQQFWLWPFFEPQQAAAVIPGQAERLGTNVVDAYRTAAGDAKLLGYVKCWVRWFEENWTALFSAPQVVALQTKAVRSLQARKGTTRVPEQIAFWDEITRAVSEWEIG